MMRALRALCAFALVLAIAPGAGPARASDAPQPSRAGELVRLAVAHEHGEGVPRAQERAAALYCEAARLGDAEGLYGLGWMYANGRGVTRNDSYAATLFAMAAFLGHEYAQRMTHFTGEMTGALPDCLHRADAQDDGEPWDAERFLASLKPDRREIGRLVAGLAPEYGVHPRLALAVAVAESALDPHAQSPRQAMGVMQLIPETAERFAVGKPWDPEQNIRGGLRYLRWLLAYFRGDVVLAVAAYNAGEGAVDRHRGVPPYRETRQYVDRVLAFAQQRSHPYDGTVAGPSPVTAPERKEGRGP